MKLGFDCDGVLADFNTAYGELIIKITGKDKFPRQWKEGIKANMFPVDWNWDTGAGYTDEELSGVWKYIRDPKNHFWESLGTLFPLEFLPQFRQIGYNHDVYFITNRPGAGAKQQTEIWLTHKGLSVNPTVLIAEDKSPIINSLKLDFYIDDRLITMNDLYKSMRENRISHENKHYYLLDTPYNRKGRSSIVKVVGSVQEGLERAGLWN